MSAFWRPFGKATTIGGIPLPTPGGGDFLLSGTLSAGDVRITLDGATLVDISALPVESPIGSGSWDIPLTAGEATAKRIAINIIDQTNPKVFDDQRIIVETYGDADAQHKFDLDATAAAAIFDALRSAHETSGSFGELLNFIFAAIAPTKIIDDKATNEITYYKEDGSSVLFKTKVQVVAGSDDQVENIRA